MEVLGLVAETGLEPVTFQLQAPSNDHWTAKLLIQFFSTMF